MMENFCNDFLLELNNLDEQKNNRGSLLVFIALFDVNLKYLQC